MTFVAGRLWPSQRWPRLRRAARSIYYGPRRNYRRMLFEIWSKASQLRHGATRWIDVHGVKVLVRTDDLQAYWLSRAGGLQSHLVEGWQALAERGPEVCIDVGANYGEFSVAVAPWFSGKLVAVEANPDLCRCLQETLRPFPNAHLVHAAAAEGDGGTARLFVRRRMSGYASLARQGTRHKDEVSHVVATVRDDEVAVHVPRRTVSSLVAESWGGSYPRSCILKVDVEGYEDVVLDGAAQLLEQCTWWRAIVEFNRLNVIARGMDPADAWRRLRRHKGKVIAAADAGGSGGNGIASAVRTKILKAELPEVPPDYSDVLIGEGELP